MSDPDQKPEPPTDEPVKEDYAPKDDQPRTLAELIEKYSKKKL